MARTVEEMALGADQLGEFYSLVQKEMSHGPTLVSDETFITEEVMPDPDCEVVQVVVYGSRGTNLLLTMDDDGWHTEKLEIEPEEYAPEWGI